MSRATWPTNTIIGVKSCMRDMDAGRGIGGARAARDKADAGPPGRLADGFRHHGGAALLPADRDVDVAVVERIERREIAFARHAEHMLHAMRDQLIDEDFAAGSRSVIGAHRYSLRQSLTLRMLGWSDLRFVPPKRDAGTSRHDASKAYRTIGANFAGSISLVT